MILAYLLLLTGLTISSVAIYYSVVGLTAIFSAAAVPIMIMGVSLEVAKLVCATWIKQHWAQVPRLMKIYMCIAITVLMLITSMGIFGFLSKAHNDQNLVSGDVQSKIAIYDEKIKTARDNIEADRKSLKQMDEAVDQVMGRSSDEKGADKAVAIRRSQAKDRQALAKDIEANQKIISTLNDEAAPIRAEIRKVDAEVGPIKYIAAFLYGTTPDAGMLEKAVTWIIILIVIVFDPLAVIMLLASQMTFAWEKKQEEVKLPTQPIINIDEVNDMLEEAKEETFREGDYCPYVPEQTFVDTVQEDHPFRGKGPMPSIPMTASYIKPKTSEEIVHETIEEIYPEIEPVKEEYTSPNAPGLDASLERPGDYLKPDETIPEIPNPRASEAAPARNRGVMHSHLAEADNGLTLGKAANSDFGNAFPANPEKGDVYLRTDYLPNRLFKFNDYKWIEVDKESTDVYAYEEAYIKHLIEEIENGRYDADMLTDVEREQIQQYLSKNV